MKQYKQFKGVYEKPKGKRFSLFTRNLVPGKKVYDEFLFKDKGIEFREWNHNRSKLAAALMKGVKEIGIKENDFILYLGAASGTTASHISDMFSRISRVKSIECEIIFWAADFSRSISWFTFFLSGKEVIVC